MDTHLYKQRLFKCCHNEKLETQYPAIDTPSFHELNTKCPLERIVVWGVMSYKILWSHFCKPSNHTKHMTDKNRYRVTSHPGF